MTTPSFKKTVSQKNAIKEIVASDARNFCLYGGSRSGKSFIILRNILIRAAKAPNSGHCIVRETFSSAKTSIWQKTLPDVLRICFPNLGGRFNHTDYVYTLPNGAYLKIAGLDDQKKVERLLGTEYSTLWFNESNQISFPAVNKLKTRLAEKNDLKKVSYFDLNPTKTSSWVYQLFEQKVNPQDGENLHNPEDYLSIRMNIQDNLENVDEEYLKLLESLPELERKRFLLGEYDDSNLGAAVYAFNEKEHVSKDAVKLPGTCYVGSDFNIDFNSDVLLSRHAHGIFVWDEVQLAGDTFKKAAALKALAPGAHIISDSTGKARRTSGKSDHIILREAGFHVVHTLNPHVTDKIANLNRCFTLGLIKINPDKCKKLIRDLKQLVWDKHGQLDQKTDPSLSHLVDALAYACWKLFPLQGQTQARIRLR